MSKIDFIKEKISTKSILKFTAKLLAKISLIGFSAYGIESILRNVVQPLEIGFAIGITILIVYIVFDN